MAGSSRGMGRIAFSPGLTCAVSSSHSTHFDALALRDQKSKKTSRAAISFASCGLNASLVFRSRQS